MTAISYNQVLFKLPSTPFHEANLGERNGPAYVKNTHFLGENHPLLQHYDAVPDGVDSQPYPGSYIEFLEKSIPVAVDRKSVV